MITSVSDRRRNAVKRPSLRRHIACLSSHQ